MRTGFRVSQFTVQVQLLWHTYQWKSFPFKIIYPRAQALAWLWSCKTLISNSSNPFVDTLSFCYLQLRETLDGFERTQHSQNTQRLNCFDVPAFVSPKRYTASKLYTMERIERNELFSHDKSKHDDCQKYLQQTRCNDIVYIPPATREAWNVLLFGHNTEKIFVLL